MIKRQRYVDAKTLAIKMHSLQKYDSHPYHKHLQDVEDVLIEFGVEKDDDLIICAWLHDILEDCPLTYNDIKKQFGEKIAEIVYCVTDELGRNRKERKKKTYPKIRSNSDAIIIKLADRIANLRNCILNNHGMIKAYIKEHDEFRNELYKQGVAENMWEELTIIIKSLNNENI